MPIYPTKHWRTLNEKVIQCDLCPNFCKITKGRRGRCFVRGNEDGRMALYTDGKSSGMQVDPIEKKPLNHFLPATRVLSFGTIGCNLSCKYCQNWHITRTKEEERLDYPVDPAGIADLAAQHRCDSIAFTYNDPVIIMEFAEEVSRHAHAAGISTVAVTAGYITAEARSEFFSFIDATNVDLKAFSQRFYSRLCNAKLGPVLDTLGYIKGSGTWMEITNLVIPGWNDDMDEIREMCKWTRELLGDRTPLHFTAFHPDSQMMDTPHTPPETLERARQIALDCGLRYVYTGNVHGRDEGGATRCNSCNNVLISRDWYDTLTPGLDTSTGACLQCGEKCDGVFAASRYPGSIRISRPFRVPPPRAAALPQAAAVRPCAQPRAAAAVA
eukprot:TRINITY_DN55741_c0_g1_i1.p1 TRINITY_DN55741_c0_g1~~TRINITY_DN55741_c0_g1_i1.p1  ORF type:complete len:407 (+),score=120.99 TRINITY_DN55741_c0_g1_i1:71-1222(+)